MKLNFTIWPTDAAKREIEAKRKAAQLAADKRGLDAAAVPANSSIQSATADLRRTGAFASSWQTKPRGKGAVVIESRFPGGAALDVGAKILPKKKGGFLTFIFHGDFIRVRSVQLPRTNFLNEAAARGTDAMREAFAAATQRGVDDA